MKPIFLHVSILLFTAVALSCFEGCKKGDNSANPAGNGGSGYALSFKANGTQVKYTSETAAFLAYTATSKMYSGILEGFHDYSTTSNDHIAILIFDDKAITTGVYQDPEKAADANGTKAPKVTINYYKDATNNYISMGEFVDENGNMVPGTENAVADAKVTITKVTSASVEGSFSATVFLSSDPSFKTKVLITEGKFTLKRLQ